jgi:hypothetical protein
MTSKFRKWTDEDTAHGRLLLLDAVLHQAAPERFAAFMEWLEQNVMVNASEVRRVMGMCVAAGDGARAVKLYDAMMEGYSPRAERIGHIARWLALMFVALGVLGGLLAGISFLWRRVHG